MRKLCHSLTRLAVLGAIASAAAVALADTAVIVATVGAAKLSAADVTERLARLPAYQLATLGRTPEEIRRQYVDRVLVSELACAQEAARLHLSESGAVHDRMREILDQALESSLRQELTQSGGVTDAEVKAYFEAHRARFETPRRIRIWRIVVADEGAAKRIIQQSAGTDGVKNWGQFAREQSLDKATNQRDGDLGFVRADGTTDVPELMVSPQTFAEVDKVQDGEIVPDPVREGERWAVLWRRGTMPAVSRTLEQEHDAIRNLLVRQKLEESTRKLASQLAAKSVHDVHYELLEYVTVNPFGDVAERERPGLLPRRRARAAPEKGDRGLR